ncbi:MAG: cyclic pyranopterin monophosphate synthase MoaC [Chloroflexota bacterium]|nr:MAG: cyclic pyranopterin monophosphate synthase MoaC [Chloroflexota bacterium]
MGDEASSRLTHIDAAGRPRMVDVSAKDETERVAIARGTIRMRSETVAAIRGGTTAKGDVLGVAQTAAIMAAKRTWELIPMCHPLAISGIDVDFGFGDDGRSIRMDVTVRLRGKTGVEMEALTAVSVGLLTVYDMCKAIDRGMTIESIGLVHKAGGKSGTWSRAATP